LALQIAQRRRIQASRKRAVVRNTFINKLQELAEKDERIILLVGDLGFSVIEEFQTKFPERFINAGIAEANMVGLAAGLALSGKKVFLYSITPFVTMRCFEQVRNDICYQNLDVILVGVGPGYAYGPAGPTHHAIEDVAVMRALPNMKVLCPGDPVEAGLCAEFAAKEKGPLYIRMGKGKEPVLHKNIPRLKLGKGIYMSEGKDLGLIASGNILPRAAEAKELLEKEGMSVSLISMPFVKPLDEELVLKEARSAKAIFTLEEHSLIGGLGEAVSKVLAENKFSGTFKTFGIPDLFPKSFGSQDYLREQVGLSAADISQTILKLL